MKKAKSLIVVLVAVMLAAVAQAQHPTFNATVAAPTIALLSSITAGNSLSVAVPVSIQTPSPVTVTVTSSDNTKVLVASTLGASGSSSATFSNVSSGSFVLYVDGVASSGTATLTASATGYVNSTSSVTLRPSGFAIYSWTPNAGGAYAPGTSAQIAGASDAGLTICPFILDGSNNVMPASFTTTISPGVSTASVTVSSSNPGVGTIGGSPVSFAAGDGCHSTATLHAVTSGSTTISVSTPAGWATPN